MKNVIFFASLFILSAVVTSFSANVQQLKSNPFSNQSIINAFERSKSTTDQSVSPNFQIKNIQTFGEKSGVVYTGETLFRTDDDGTNWREIVLPSDSGETISAVTFATENKGWAILFDERNTRLELAGTNDGGFSWTKTIIDLRHEDLIEANLENAVLQFSGNNLSLSLPLPTSSNFRGESVYRSRDGGNNWEHLSRSIRKNSSDNEIKTDSRWSLKSSGECAGYKSGCFQETRIFAGVKEITPAPIKNLARIERENAALEINNSVFARAAPDGSTRISLNRGFDKCTAAPVSQMQTWWNTSPFYDSNIYISGRNRGCSQPQLTAAWVNQVSAMGWGLIPTIVGYQAPCSVSTNSSKHSSDPATAETQGRGEADIAISDANNLGLTQGTVLYYDMERYDETSATPGCRASVNAFLKGWTDRLKERNYISGVYGSPTNAAADWVNIPAASRMDAIWMARWDNVPSVWYYAPPSPALPDNIWSNYQRIKQYQAPHNETWGGVTFNIDGNIANGPVAGIKIAKNKTADFDGDGKTDLSVYRPETGIWYLITSSNSVFGGIAFGNASDVPAPGDYDGDGKTDAAVFRPADSTWYMQMKAGFSGARQFGASGDIAVPADYNGDGKTDVAVFRPSTGVWYIANSDNRGTFTIVQFGLSEDKPVPADYDGDGRADIAVWRPSTGVWYVLKSSDGNFTATGFGISTDKPAQGDYDGDGKTDFAVYRDGIWYILQTTAGISIQQFGLAGDLPVTGDFDGDNKADIAVFRPSNGAWYLLQSANGFHAVGFGLSADKPIPNMYLPQ
ncbi:MAG: DUF1906 domain-containing protein [Acidobacteriota bacterium]|nr:DUF1906 domain-containing protein [Acidobacteriota bacterium]